MADPNLKSLTKALTDLATHSKEQKEHLSNIADGVKPLSVAGGIITKGLEMLIGSVVGGTKTLAEMRIQNADLLVDQKRMRDLIQKQGFSIGTLAQHSQMQLNLHRIGYKEINKDLREQLVWLEKTGGQGQDLLKFMSTLIEKGADLSTQTLIAQKIADVSRYTGQSARAAISAAEQMGDQITVLKAIGLDDDVLEAVLIAAEEMPGQNAATLGKFAEAMVNPKDITKSMMLGMYQGGKDFLAENASTQDRVAALMRTAEEAGSLSERFLKQAGGDPWLLQKYRETFLGDAGILSIQVKNAIAMKGTATDIGTGADSFKDSTKEYAGSFQNVADTLESAGQIVASTFEDQLLGESGLISYVFELVESVKAFLPSWETISDSMYEVVDWFTNPLTKEEATAADAFDLTTRVGAQAAGMDSTIDMGSKEHRNFMKRYVRGYIETAKAIPTVSTADAIRMQREVEDLMGYSRNSRGEQQRIGGMSPGDAEYFLREQLADTIQSGGDSRQLEQLLFYFQRIMGKWDGIIEKRASRTGGHWMGDEAESAHSETSRLLMR